MTEQTTAGPAVEIDEFAREVARSATGLLAELNHPEGLSAADVHVARRLGALAGCEDEQVLVAAALAVRAVRQGSVCLDLDGGRAQGLLSEGGWDVDQWSAALLASPLARAADDSGVTPLVLDGHRLYLDRYWAEEGQVVQNLRERGAATAPGSADLDTALERYFPAAQARTNAEQRAAAEAACTGWTTVVTGGPGTGKTTTIARLLGVLLETDPDLRIALAAPTGRAAARLGEAVAEVSDRDDYPQGPAREQVRALEARTLHRLLGWLPGRRGFRHNRTNRLPYDVVVVDETSMVSLTLMARLLDAMRPQARLVLVGDADQLASVDAGAVLGDLVKGVAGGGPAQVRKLVTTFRYGGEIGDLAAAIRDEQPERVLELLGQERDAVDPDSPVQLVARAAIEPLLLAHALELREHAASGNHARALEALEEHRLLCAHREGPFGAGYWNRWVERALADQLGLGSLGTWYPGRPVIVSENDYGLGLYNGDLGVVVPSTDPERRGLDAVIAGGGGQRPVGRLPEVRSAYAMTVHRSQGSQVQHVTVLLPEAASPLLTRQLLYTAVTRAQQQVRVVGTPESVRAAVVAAVPRASGLAERLTA